MGPRWRLTDDIHKLHEIVIHYSVEVQREASRLQDARPHVSYQALANLHMRAVMIQPFFPQAAEPFAFLNAERRSQPRPQSPDFCEESLGIRLRRPVRRNSPAGTKSVLRLSTASISATIFLATASIASHRQGLGQRFSPAALRGSAMSASSPMHPATAFRLDSSRSTRWRARDSDRSPV